MGASGFMTISPGKTAQEAFSSAVKEAKYESGHGGYTGTIAEKDCSVTIEPAKTFTLTDAKKLANKLMNEDDKRIADKRGPAGCIKIDDGRFLFFGYASC